MKLLDRRLSKSRKKLFEFLVELTELEQGFYGYDLSRKLDIPLSTIYKTLETLCNEKVLYVRTEVQENTPARKKYRLNQAYVRQLQASIDDYEFHQRCNVVIGCEGVSN